MKFKIPFTIGTLDSLKKRPTFFSRFIKPKKHSFLQQYLGSCDVDITREQYLAVALRYSFMCFFVVFVFSTTLFFFSGVSQWFLFGVGFGMLCSGFMFFSQILYPKVYSSRRQKNVERNLIPALEDMLVQLNSGVPLFNILVNISSSDYGELSIEFKKAIREINAGSSQIDVLEKLGDRNSSLFFRRTLWQISNGMKAGSDLNVVIKESIKSLNEEQILQIQNYGNKLNPLIMFYMLVSVILPALSVTFLTIISSMVNLPQNTTMLLFVTMYIFTTFIQIMFLGMIRSTRPSLL